MEDQKDKIPALLAKDVLSVRLTADDRAFLAENFEELTDGEDVTAPRRLLLMLAQKALSRKTTVTVTDPVQAEMIKQLTTELKQLQKENEAQALLINEPDQQAQADRAALAEMETYFWPYLAITERAGKASNLFELFKFMLQQLHAGSAFIPDDEDKAYIKSLKAGQ